MNKLIGIKWGSLKEETKEWLLERSSCIDGVTGNNIENGECIVDLTSILSIEGEVVDGEIFIDNNAIIYNPEEGTLLEEKTDIILEIDEVMTISEICKRWNKTEGAIRSKIKNRKLIPGVDFRKSGSVTLLSKQAMEREYGKNY